MKYREIAKKLKKLGCQEIPRRSGGSHRKWYNPKSNRIVAIPDWGNKDLKLGTLRQIIRQLDLDWEEFKHK
ncbi:type II toxin-antitoxin system HicA family toxin [Crocosphaera chwakensis]|uniref:YcfA-like protein n=1 Tax=Crocosphaera chwakensis CCY0110 TaxID=391612 RepID=A3IGX6_9CHRO|nr:type II toxin-antitoxin system HicA family toxin [Crocosphaera chwakensis]EAZ94218.1 YcfA-like protein [Crocosphaera chwakensis CCY0110]